MTEPTVVLSITDLGESSTSDDGEIPACRFLRTGLLGLGLGAAIVVPAHADATVKVSLWHKGGTMDMSKSMGLGMGMKGDMKMAIMGTDIEQKSIPASKVTFEVSNASKETIHEMLVAPVAIEDTVLPFISAENRADKEKSFDLGEVSELDPGKSGGAYFGVEARTLNPLL